MADTQDKRRVVTGKVRFSYLNVFEPRPSEFPGGKPKYSVQIILPKSDTATYAKIMAAVEAAKEFGKEKLKAWGGKIPAGLHLPLHDGDSVKENKQEPYGPECENCWVFTASNEEQPGLVDASCNPILSQADLYSGCYGRVAIQLFAYGKGKNGIGVSLGNLQKLEDGVPLSSVAVKPEKDFADGGGFLD